MIGYKVTNKDGRSSAGNKQLYESGETYEVNGPLEIGSNGFHFCKYLIECNDFYKFLNDRYNFKYFKVEAFGEILNGGINNDDIYCTDKIRIVEEILIEHIDEILKN